MFKVSAHYVTTGTEMVSRFVDSSVNDVLLRTIQTSIVTFWIHQHSWKSSGWHSAAWQSDSVIDWLFGATGPKI